MLFSEFSHKTLYRFAYPVQGVSRHDWLIESIQPFDIKKIKHKNNFLNIYTKLMLSSLISYSVLLFINVADFLGKWSLQFQACRFFKLKNY